jgi:hypothetical protein
MQMKSPDFNEKYDVLKSELLNTGVVPMWARANYAITDTRGLEWWFQLGGQTACRGPVVQPYFRLVRILVILLVGKLLQGRDFFKRYD